MSDETRVVTGSIAPIEASKLMNLGPSEPKPAPIELHLPQFERPPGFSEQGMTFGDMKVTDFTATRADEVARKIIAVQGQMPINELSVDLLNLAYAYISARNE